MRAFIKSSIIVLLAFTVSACAGAAKEEKILLSPIIIPKQKIEYPIPKLSLIPVIIDAPRDLDKITVKADRAECINVTNDTKDEKLKARCLEHPIDFSKSNLYRGYDRANWDNQRINTARTDEYIKALLSIINQMNSSIRKDNEEAQKKLEEIRSSNTATPK